MKRFRIPAAALGNGRKGRNDHPFRDCRLYLVYLFAGRWEMITFLTKELTQRGHRRDRFRSFQVFSKAGSEGGMSHAPPGLDARTMKVGADLSVPTLPLLVAESDLLPLEPGVLKKFVGRKDERQRAQSLLFGGCLPIFGHVRKRPSHFRALDGK